MLATAPTSTKTQALWPLFLTISAGFRSPLLMALLAMIASFALLFTVPMITRSMLDRLTGEAPDTYLTWLQNFMPSGLSDDHALYLQLGLSGILIVLCTALAGYFVYLRGKQIAAAAEGMARRLRDTLMNHLNHLPIAFHHQADTGDLIQRCTSDIETFRVFVSGQIIEIGRAVLMLLIVTPILLSLDVTMTGVALITMPLLLLSAVLFFNRVKAMFLEVDEAEASLTTVLQENLTGIRVVRAFARQDFEAEKFGRANARFRDQNQRLMRFLGFYYGASDIVCLFQVGLILFVGAHWVLADAMTIGTLFAFITYEGMIIWPIRHMGRVLTDSGKAVVALKRMAEILSEPEESNLEQALTAPLSGRIKLNGVTFHHQNNPPVLSNLSLTIAAGETVALVGAPGAGKSTLIQLLLRLYDPQQGSLWVDDFDLSQLSRKSVRAQMGVVLQESFLFAGSIADNLRIGQTQASLADMTEAVTTANLLDTIDGLPNGFDALVGERGVTLSGGQRQRLAIARALLKDPAILILDDALSAVDTDTESLILDNLRRVRANRTTLIVAHRLSTVMHADRIIVLADGEVAQIGNHATLSQTPGIYRQLCELQGQVQDDIQQSRTSESKLL
ncbi:MAG: ABC transporter ATP-binding protein [Pseudomonadales bacterium]|nr:ABC transporter ATP-binding protein [Pseudomonadales bacterium]